MILAAAIAVVLGPLSGAASAEPTKEATGDTPRSTVAEQRNAPAASASDAAAVVTKRLMETGLTKDEASQRVRELTQADLQKLAEHPEQVAMAGIKDSTLIIIAVILIVPSVLLLLLI